MTHFLGLDIGTTHIKCVRYDVGHGKIDAVATRPTPVMHPVVEQSEHDPEVLWHTAANCISEVAADHRI